MNTLVDPSKGCLTTKLRVVQLFFVRRIAQTSLRQVQVKDDAQLKLGEVLLCLGGFFWIKITIDLEY